MAICVQTCALFFLGSGVYSGSFSHVPAPQSASLAGAAPSNGCGAAGHSPPGRVCVGYFFTTEMVGNTQANNKQNTLMTKAVDKAEASKTIEEQGGGLDN